MVDGAVQQFGHNNGLFQSRNWPSSTTLCLCPVHTPPSPIGQPENFIIGVKTEKEEEKKRPFLMTHRKSRD